MDAIDKYYFDKGFRNVKTTIETKQDTGLENSVTLVFYINKGDKVKINQINFVDNTVDELKLKKTNEGNKRNDPHYLVSLQMIRVVLQILHVILLVNISGIKDFFFYKNKHVLDPYIRLKYFLQQNSMIKNMKKIKKK